MDSPYNQPPPPPPIFVSPASSSFSIPVPVFPTTESFPSQQVVQGGEEQLQPTTADFSSVQAYPSSSPNYNQMITAAILALKERDGSSRQAIAKYIERVYSSSLSSEHSTLLTQHLRRMKDSGQLVLVKHSYMLSGSAPPPSPSPAFAPEVLADMPKRSPGRPPKLKPVMNASSVQQAPVNDTVGSGTFAVPESLFASIGLVDGLPEPDSLPKRRPGRPKKVVGIAGVSTDQNVTDGARYVPDNQPVPVTQPVFANQPMTEVTATGIADPPVKRRPGRPPRNGSINVGPAVAVNRPRGPGRPKQKAGVYTGKPRGRPRRNVEAPAPLDAVSAGAEGVPVAHVGDGAVPMGRKRGRPGRPPKSANEPKKPSQLFGKTLGHHKQNAPATTAHVSNLQQLLAYQELRGKLEFFQSRMKHTVGILKPVLESQTSSDANEALQELEELSTLDITAASSLHDMQLLPPNQV